MHITPNKWEYVLMVIINRKTVSTGLSTEGFDNGGHYIDQLWAANQSMPEVVGESTTTIQTLTASLRFPRLMRYLLQLAKTKRFSDPNSNILLLGGGLAKWRGLITEKPFTPQPIEVLSVFPSSNITVIDRNTEVCKAVNNARDYSFNYKAQDPESVEGVTAQDFAEMLGALAELLRTTQEQLAHIKGYLETHGDELRAVRGEAESGVSYQLREYRLHRKAGLFKLNPSVSERLKAFQGEFQRINYGISRVDLIISTVSLGYAFIALRELPSARTVLLTKLVSALKPGGKMILSDYDLTHYDERNIDVDSYNASFPPRGFGPMSNTNEFRKYYLPQLLQSRGLNVEVERIDGFWVITKKTV